MLNVKVYYIKKFTYRGETEEATHRPKQYTCSERF